MPINAKELGLEGTMNELRKLLVERFKVCERPESIRADDPLFEAGVGLSSVDGVDLLLEIEKRFNVQFGDFEEWITQSPTVNSFAQYLVEKGPSTNS